MKKYLLIPIFLFLLSSCTLPFSSPDTGKKIQSSTGSEIKQVVLVQTGQTREEKMDESKRRINFRSIIRKGDYFSLKSDQETALKYYLNAYLRLKEDHVLERKIA